MVKILGRFFQGKYYSFSTEDGKAAYAAAVSATSVEHSDLPCPALHTDTSYFRGNDDGFGNCEVARRKYHSAAQSAGISTTGKRYCPEIAKHGGGTDAEAWVPQTQGRSHIKRVIQNRRWSCEGRINVKPPDYDTPTDAKPYQVSRKLAEKITRDEIVLNKLDVSQQERSAMVEQNIKVLSGNMG
jgi:hypothetical protein